jgi:uncharacterized membrane protein HdeD (DUF308 family)
MAEKRAGSFNIQKLNVISTKELKSEISNNNHYYFVTKNHICHLRKGELFMNNVINTFERTIRNWWLFLLIGIILIGGSIWVILTPLKSYVGLAWLFSVIIFANGIANTVFSIQNRKQITGSGWHIASGIFEIIFGLILLLYPGISLLILPIIFGFWLMFRAVSVISIAWILRDNQIKNWGWLFAFGILLALISFFMILNPLFGILNVVYWTAFSLMIFGIADITLAFQFKKIKSSLIDYANRFEIENHINSIDDFEKEIFELLEEIPETTKEKIHGTFSDYKSKLT